MLFMNKFRLAIFILIAISILIFIIVIGFQNIVSIWPINKLMKTVNSSVDIFGDSGNISFNGNQPTSAGSLSSTGSQNPRQSQYDINGDNSLTCELSSQGNYSINGNHITVNIQGKNVSFDFQKIAINNVLHPDNLPSVNLKFNLLPENPDNIIYSNIFIAYYNKLYVCE